MFRNSLWVIIGLAATIALVVGCSSPPPIEPETFKVNRPSYYGYCLAAPASPLPEFPQLASAKLEQILPINLELKISKNGRVKQITPKNSELPAEWDSFSSLIKQMKFYPGRSGGKIVEQILPIQLVLGRKSYQNKFLSPVDSLGVVLDHDLYWAGMRLNHIDLPTLDSFPSYFIDADKKDTSTILNYLLARLDLDSSGRIQEYEIIHSDAGQYTDEIIQAANWAEYNVTQTGSNHLQSVYLKIALYGMVPYPTFIQHFPIDTLALPERERIKLLPDTVGLMFKPFPKGYQNGGVYSIMGGRMANIDTVNIQISIGIDGKISHFNPIGASTSQKEDYRRLAVWMRFFPALDYNGVAQPFSGIIRLEYMASTIVRIKFLWFEIERAEYPPKSLKTNG